MNVILHMHDHPSIESTVVSRPTKVRVPYRKLAKNWNCTQANRARFGAIIQSLVFSTHLYVHCTCITSLTYCLVRLDDAAEVSLARLSRDSIACTPEDIYRITSPHSKSYVSRVCSVKHTLLPVISLLLL